MGHVTIDKLDIDLLLSSTKPIWSQRGTVPYPEWVYMDGDVAYVFNGYFFYSQPFKGIRGAFPAPQMAAFLGRVKKDSLTVTVTDTSTRIAADNAESSFDLPFDIEEQMRSFYLEQGDFLPVADLGAAQKFCSQCIHKDNIEYSNVYIKDRFMYSTDGYRIAMHMTHCDDTSIPIGTDKIFTSLRAEPRGAAVSRNVVSFKVGPGVLSCLKNIGKASSVVRYVPEAILPYRFIIEDVKEAQSLLTQIRKFDLEFKRRDLFVDVAVDGAVITLTLNGIRATLSERLTLSESVAKPFSFRVNPAFFSDLIGVSPVIQYSLEESFISAEQDQKTMYLWVDRG